MMTKTYDAKTESKGVESRDIVVTEAMIEAGVDRFKDFTFGQNIPEVIEAIYLAMEIERLNYT